jgi:uncharacterized protein (DUF433 family)
MSVEDIVREWPELEPEDVFQSLAFAASGMEEDFFVRESSAAA